MPTLAAPVGALAAAVGVAGVCAVPAARAVALRPDAFQDALTQLEADALITLDRQLADVVTDLVAVAHIEALF